MLKIFFMFLLFITSLHAQTFWGLFLTRGGEVSSGLPLNPPTINSFAATGGNMKVDLSLDISDADNIEIWRYGYFSDLTTIYDSIKVYDDTYSTTYSDSGYRYGPKPAYDSARNFNGIFQDGLVQDSGKFRRNTELVPFAQYGYKVKATNGNGSVWSSIDTCYTILSKPGNTIFIYARENSDIPAWVSPTITTTPITAINADNSHIPGDIILLRASDNNFDNALWLNESDLDSSNVLTVRTWGNPQIQGYPRARLKNESATTPNGKNCTVAAQFNDKGIRLEYLEIMPPDSTDAETQAVHSYQNHGRLEIYNCLIHGNRGYDFEYIGYETENTPIGFVMWGIQTGINVGQLYIENNDIGGFTQPVRLSTTTFEWAYIRNNYIHHATKNYNVSRNNSDLMSCGNRAYIYNNEFAVYGDDLLDLFGGADSIDFRYNLAHSLFTDTVYAGKGIKSGSGAVAYFHVIGNIFRDLITANGRGADNVYSGALVHFDSSVDTNVVIAYNYLENTTMCGIAGIGFGDAIIYNNTLVNTGLASWASGNSSGIQITTDGTTDIHNNIFSITGAVTIRDITLTGTGNITHNITTHASSYFNGGTQSDNMFSTNPLLNADGSLQAGSPAINAGTTISGGVSLDIRQNPIVGVRDIGAFEDQ